MYAFIRVLLSVFSHICAFALICVLSSVLSYVCSHICALICLLLCDLICVSSSSSSPPLVLSPFAPPDCLGCFAGMIFLGGRCSTLDVPSFMLRGRRSTSDVSCCVFSANGIVRAARSGEQMYFVRMKFGRSFARNIVLEVANLEVLRQTRRKASTFNLASKYQNWRNSRTKCSF